MAGDIAVNEWVLLEAVMGASNDGGAGSRQSQLCWGVVGAIAGGDIACMV